MSNHELGLKELETAKYYLRLAEDAREKAYKLLQMGGRKPKKPVYDFSEDLLKSDKRRGLL